MIRLLSLSCCASMALFVLLNGSVGAWASSDIVEERATIIVDSIKDTKTNATKPPWQRDSYIAGASAQVKEMIASQENHEEPLLPQLNKLLKQGWVLKGVRLSSEVRLPGEDGRGFGPVLKARNTLRRPGLKPILHDSGLGEENQTIKAGTEVRIIHNLDFSITKKDKTGIVREKRVKTVVIRSRPWRQAVYDPQKRGARPGKRYLWRPDS